MCMVHEGSATGRNCVRDSESLQILSGFRDSPKIQEIHSRFRRFNKRFRDSLKIRADSFKIQGFTAQDFDDSRRDSRIQTNS